MKRRMSWAVLMPDSLTIGKPSPASSASRIVVLISTLNVVRSRLLIPSRLYASCGKADHRPHLHEFVAPWTSTSTVMRSSVARIIRSISVPGGSAAAMSRDGVGPGDAALVDLCGVDDEVLAEHRQPDDGLDLGNVLQAALEVRLVGPARSVPSAVASL